MQLMSFSNTTAGSRVVRTVRARLARPTCPVCPGRRATSLVRVEIEEIPGLTSAEIRDWRCGQCGAVIRQQH